MPINVPAASPNKTYLVVMAIFSWVFEFIGIYNHVTRPRKLCQDIFKISRGELGGGEDEQKMI